MERDYMTKKYLAENLTWCAIAGFVGWIAFNHDHPIAGSILILLGSVGIGILLYSWHIENKIKQAEEGVMGE